VKSKCGLSGRELLWVWAKLSVFFAYSWAPGVGINLYRTGIFSLMNLIFFILVLSPVQPLILASFTARQSVYKPGHFTALLFAVPFLLLWWCYWCPRLDLFIALYFGLYLVCAALAFMLYRAYKLPVVSCDIDKSKGVE